MTRNVKISLLVVGAFALVVAGLLFATRPAEPPSGAGGTASADALAPADAPRLNDAPGASVTLVEFLDFQCPGCGQLQPIMGQIAQQYGDRVQFVIRDFPLPMHRNAEPAAVAAEAAHQQGRFVPMYERLFGAQHEWAEQADPAPLFRGYAEQLGLDMAAYDAAVADPATLERVRADRAAGEAAGVQGTPTIFVNGEQVEVSSVKDITDALDAAVNR
ncbi:thioredoxin domain-containing protein [Pseudonocardia sp. C8]|uniref:DsbA family protein n=1 Tax=Pseudonocardia sp. C8 TaxID=2762759 RepID=UPI001642B745|nr:thioredoxin domain-containing protein [Pseudonocardia sp. C8]MBC3193030.1 thioredoxin domain-containing protein [Pseudonocardia sp. C8]